MTDNEGTWEPVEPNDFKRGDTLRSTWIAGVDEVTYERLTPPPRTFEPGEPAEIDFKTTIDLVERVPVIRSRENQGEGWWTAWGQHVPDERVTRVRRLVVLDEERIAELGERLFNSATDPATHIIRAFVEREAQR